MALKSITGSKLTFDERVVLQSVVPAVLPKTFSGERERNVYLCVIDTNLETTYSLPFGPCLTLRVLGYQMKFIVLRTGKKGPSWGYPGPVLGAVAPFLSEIITKKCQICWK